MKGLKIITSLLLLAVICTADESNEEIIKELEKYESECREEFGLEKNEKDVKKLCADDEVDEKFNCYVACFHKKIGGMKDGEILLDRVKETIMPLIKEESAKNELSSRLDSCKAETSTISNECDKIVGFIKCLIKGTEFCRRVLKANE